VVPHSEDDIVAAGNFGSSVDSVPRFFDCLVSGRQLADVILIAKDFQPRRLWLSDERRRCASDFDPPFAARVAYNPDRCTRGQTSDINSIFILRKQHCRLEPEPNRYVFGEHNFPWILFLSVRRNGEDNGSNKPGLFEKVLSKQI
jgi:hypothetical protein